MRIIHNMRLASRQLSSIVLGLIVAVTGSAVLTSYANAESLNRQPSTVSVTWQPNCTELDPNASSNQQCGTLQVPLNYKDPNGRKITVAVSRIPAADPSHRRGVLLLNPGGPGGAGIDLPSQFTTLMPQNVLDQYD